MMTPISLARAVCQLNALLDLDNLATRRSSRRRRGDRHTFLILSRLLYSKDKRLSQVVLADLLQLAVSQVQKATEVLVAENLVRRAPGAPRGGMYIVLTKEGARTVEEKLATGSKEFALFDIVWQDEKERQIALTLMARATEYIRKQVEEKA